MFQRVTKGALSGNAGEPVKEEFKINGQYVDTPAQGVVGIPFFDGYVEKAAIDYLDRNANSREPIFMSINFMKVHQPNMPHPDYIHKSMSKSKYADSVVELDCADRPHHGQDPLAADRQQHARVLHDRQRRLAGRLSRRRLHAVPRHQGHRARRRQPRSRHRLDAGQDRGQREEPRDGRRPRPDGDLRLGRRRQAADAGSRRPADHLRQLRHVAGAVRHRHVAAQRVVLLHRERAVAGRRARRQLQGRVQPARRRRRLDRRSRGRLPTSAGRARRSTSPPCRRCSTCGRTRRSATTSS